MSVSLIAWIERGGAGGAGWSQAREKKCDHFSKDSLEEGDVKKSGQLLGLTESKSDIFITCCSVPLDLINTAAKIPQVYSF